MTTPHDLYTAIRAEFKGKSKFCDQVINAAKALNLPDYSVIEVRRYTYARKFLQMIAQLSDNRILLFDNCNSEIYMHANPDGLPLDQWLNTDHTETPITTFTDLDNPNPDFMQ